MKATTGPNWLDIKTFEDALTALQIKNKVIGSIIYQTTGNQARICFLGLLS